MPRAYDLIAYRAKHTLWVLWHCNLTRLFGCRSTTADEPRPWWHMCCNGNAGGWRTRLCDRLEDYETGYRKHEDYLWRD